MRSLTIEVMVFIANLFFYKLNGNCIGLVNIGSVCLEVTDNIAILNGCGNYLPLVSPNENRSKVKYSHIMLFVVIVRLLVDLIK